MGALPAGARDHAASSSLGCACGMIRTGGIDYDHLKWMSLRPAAMITAGNASASFNAGITTDRSGSRAEPEALLSRVMTLRACSATLIPRGYCQRGSPTRYYSPMLSKIRLIFE
jgi:hypothetical protein